MAFASKDGNRRERRTKKNGKLFKAIIYQMYIYIYRVILEFIART